ncbi:MAG: hypothetical protein ACK5NI_01050 [bacterium]
MQIDEAVFQIHFIVNILSEIFLIGSLSFDLQLVNLFLRKLSSLKKISHHGLSL